jgi:hypothetical protein
VQASAAEQSGLATIALACRAIFDASSGQLRAKYLVKASSRADRTSCRWRSTGLIRPGAPRRSGVPRISWTRPLSALRVGLEGFWADASDVAVASGSIVEGLNVIGHVCCGPARGSCRSVS